MKNRIFAASHERAKELIAAGCPLDYPEALPGHSAARCKTSHAEQLAGYAESRVYAISPLQTGYLIGLRLGTDRPSGTIIAEWSFTPPWPDHLIIWDYEPWDIIPAGHREAYRSFLNSRLTGVLNDRRLLRRGYPVEGLLCGCSAQPVPEPGDGLVSAKLTLVDDRGKTIALRLGLTVIRRTATWSKSSPSPVGRLQMSVASDHCLPVG
jgi:hypothetical protein